MPVFYMAYGLCGNNKNKIIVKGVCVDPLIIINKYNYAVFDWPVQRVPFRTCGLRNSLKNLPRNKQ